MSGKGADQRINQDIQILPEVVSGLYRIAAVAVDERRQISYQGIVVLTWEMFLKECKTDQS